MRRRRLLAFLAVSTVVGILALPPVHRRLAGWAKREAIWNGRPVSYWRREIAASTFVPGFRNGVVPGQAHGWPWLGRPEGVTGVLDAGRRWLDRLLGRPTGDPIPTPPMLSHYHDATTLPVLLGLLDAPEPQVRYFAALKLGALGAGGRPAIEPLWLLLADRAEVVEGITVGEAASAALQAIDPSARNDATGRP
ncbi:MAG TPA: hypothetical protein VGF55_20965 [Gemmataceae bacterium]